MAKILVVDDEKSIRISLREFLKDAGYEADIAEDAEETMALLAVGDYDLVVSDIIMPRITGVDLLKSIKEESPHIEVILMAGEPTVETASEAVRLGAFDYLSKPVTKERLLNTGVNALKAKALSDKYRFLEAKNRLHQENLEHLLKERTSALQASEERWHFALEGSRDGIWDWNVLSNEVFFSKRWKEMRGFNEDEISNHLDEWNKHIHPDDKSAVHDKLNRHFNGETPYYDSKYRALCKDGAYKWILSRGKVISWTGDHKPRRVIGTDTDINERKQAEEKIRMLSQAIEQSPVSVVITDTDANIEYVNNAFEKVTGYRSEEVIGRNPRLLKSGRIPKRHYQALWQAITNGKAWRGEIQNKKKNGEIFWEDMHIAPVLDKEGVTRHYLAVKEDITLRKQQEEQLLYQAHFDALTNLPNRFLVLDRLTQLLKEARRSKALVAVLFLDLDDFKKVNDTLGHETGDKLLIEAALRLSCIARSGDTVGRLGGDGFIVLLNGLLDVADTRPVVKNMLDQFRNPFAIEDREIILTISVGIAVFPEDGDKSPELLRKAGSAMYHAKKSGRNTSAYFTDAMNREVSRRLVLEEQMYGALDRNEFSVSYQPMLEVSSRRFVGAEALLRWHNPALGHISPEEFIPVAEQTGLILPIGQFVLTAALDLCARMRSFHDSGCHMAVNLSPLQFRDPELMSFIKKTLHQSCVPGKGLELEITEGVLMSGHAYVNDALAALSDMGVSISMDDFGTGYSSLSYLRSYPFDILKIDKSFVSDITVNPADQALINATITMAHGLNLKVVAEGVETKEQLDYLKKQGCDYTQGYFFAKPMPEDELFEWVKRNALI